MSMNKRKYFYTRKPSGTSEPGNCLPRADGVFCSALAAPASAERPGPLCFVSLLSVGETEGFMEKKYALCKGNLENQ